MYVATAATGKSPCPSGTFDDSTNNLGDGVGDCVDVQNGYQALNGVGGAFVSKGAVAEGACTDVPAGSYGSGDNGTNHATSAATGAFPCANGSFNLNGTGACTDVDPGNQAVDSTSAYVSTGAVNQATCPDGHYNLNGDGACIQVAAGYVASTSSTATATQADCSDSSTPCTHAAPCQDGSFKAAAGVGSCTDVADGKFGSRNGYTYIGEGATMQEECHAG